MTDNTRNEIRQVFFDAWNKYKIDTPLSALENQIVHVIQAHPEYHPELNNPDTLFQDYSTDDNPFLHMGLHLSLLEQIHTDRPAGIQQIYQSLSHQLDDAHRAEHLMMDVMAKLIWEAQRNGTLPDEKQYLEQLNQLLHS